MKVDVVLGLQWGDEGKGKIVELNYDLYFMIIHTVLPNNLISNNAFTKLKIEFLEDLFLIANILCKFPEFINIGSFIYSRLVEIKSKAAPNSLLGNCIVKIDIGSTSDKIYFPADKVVS